MARALMLRKECVGRVCSSGIGRVLGCYRVYGAALFMRARKLLALLEYWSRPAQMCDVANLRDAR